MTDSPAALSALQPRDIAVLGGTSAVSNTVLEQLRGYTTGGVTRLAGTDRYGTAARLVQTFWTGTAPVVYLATGRNFPDALAGVPAAGRDDAPLLLVEPTCMPALTRRELDRLPPTTTVVLGGPGTVSDAAAAGTACAPPPVQTFVPLPVAQPVAPAPVPVAPVAPARPADRDCSSFRSQAEAQAFFNHYFPFYGDVARLDGDGDGIACESLR